MGMGVCLGRRTSAYHQSIRSINQSITAVDSRAEMKRETGRLSLGRHHMIAEGRSRIHVRQAADSSRSAMLEGSQVVVFSLLCFTKDDVDSIDQSKVSRS